MSFMVEQISLGRECGMGPGSDDDATIAAWRLREPVQPDLAELPVDVRKPFWFVHS